MHTRLACLTPNNARTPRFLDGVTLFHHWCCAASSHRNQLLLVTTEDGINFINHFCYLCLANKAQSSAWTAGVHIVTPRKKRSFRLTWICPIHKKSAVCSRTSSALWGLTYSLHLHYFGVHLSEMASGSRPVTSLLEPVFVLRLFEIRWGLSLELSFLFRRKSCNSSKALLSRNALIIPFRSFIFLPLSPKKLEKRESLEINKSFSRTFLRISQNIFRKSTCLLCFRVLDQREDSRDESFTAETVLKRSLVRQ